MNRKLRITLATFIVLSTLGLIALVFAHSRFKNRVRVTFSADKKIGVQVDNVHYSGSRGGRVEWELDAKSAARAKGEDVIVLEAVRLIFYAVDGKSAYTMSSDKGRYTESTGDIEAEGGVTIRSSKGPGKDDNDTLKTERIRYSATTRRISTKEHVDISSPTMNVTGTGMLFELETDKLTVLNNVRAVVKENQI